MGGGRGSWWRVNLVGGCSERPVHGEVAGARDSEIAGEAVERNRRRERVCHDRDGAVELKSYINLTRI
jgi:hypothetical protein